MQQGDSTGIFNLLPIRRSSLPFLMVLVLSARILPLATPWFSIEVLLLTGERCGTHWDSIHGSSGSGHPHCPHLPQLQGSASHRLTPSTPTLVPSQPRWTLSCFSLPLTVVQFLSSLGSDTKISLSVSAFLIFFLMSWLQIQHNCVSGKCWPFNINFILERIISVDWQSLAALFGIISELLDDVRRSTPGWSQDLTLRKLFASHEDKRFNLSSLKTTSSFILVSVIDLAWHSSAQFHT